MGSFKIVQDCRSIALVVRYLCDLFMSQQICHHARPVKKLFLNSGASTAI